MWKGAKGTDSLGCFFPEGHMDVILLGSIKPHKHKIGSRR